MNHKRWGRVAFVNRREKRRCGTRRRRKPDTDGVQAKKKKVVEIPRERK